MHLVEIRQYIHLPTTQKGCKFQVRSIIACSADPPGGEIPEELNESKSHLPAREVIDWSENICKYSSRTQTTVLPEDQLYFHQMCIYLRDTIACADVECIVKWSLQSRKLIHPLLYNDSPSLWQEHHILFQNILNITNFSLHIRYHTCSFIAGTYTSPFLPLWLY